MPGTCRANKTATRLKNLILRERGVSGVLSAQAGLHTEATICVPGESRHIRGNFNAFC